MVIFDEDECMNEGNTYWECALRAAEELENYDRIAAESRRVRLQNEKKQSEQQSRYIGYFIVMIVLVIFVGRILYREYLKRNHGWFHRYRQPLEFTESELGNGNQTHQFHRNTTTSEQINNPNVPNDNQSSSLISTRNNEQMPAASLSGLCEKCTGCASD